MRESHQTVATGKQRLGQPPCGAWIEFIDVFISMLYVTRRGNGPNDAHASRFRRRDSLALGQLTQPFLHSFVRNDASRSVVSFRLSVEPRLVFGIRIRFNIEDRFWFWFSHETTRSEADLA